MHANLVAKDNPHGGDRAGNPNYQQRPRMCQPTDEPKDAQDEQRQANPRGDLRGNFVSCHAKCHFDISPEIQFLINYHFYRSA